MVTGNPIGEVIDHSARPAMRRRVIADLGLTAGRFVLCTIHRAETVDDPEHLATVMGALARQAERAGLPIVFPVHPRTRLRLEAAGIRLREPFVALPPLGFLDFMALERGAALVMTDSGTVQEECVIGRVPHVVVRDTTERPETVECGATIIAGRRADGIERAAEAALSLPTNWVLPAGYGVMPVAATVARIALGALPLEPGRRA